MSGSGRPEVKFNPVSDGPSIVVSDDGKTVFARAAGGFDVHVIDVASRKVVRTISGDEKGVPFNEEYGEARIKELADKMRERNSPVILVASYPEYFPPVRELSSLDNLLVVRQWAGQPDTDERFLMLDATGKELPLLCTPKNMVRLLALHGDYAYVGAHSEETDGYVVRVPRNRVNETAATHPLDGEREPRFLMQEN